MDGERSIQSSSSLSGHSAQGTLGTIWRYFRWRQLGGGGASGTLRVEVRDAANHSKMRTTCLTAKNYLAQNISSAMAEKTGFRGSCNNPDKR